MEDRPTRRPDPDPIRIDFVLFGVFTFLVAVFAPGSPFYLFWR